MSEVRLDNDFGIIATVWCECGRYISFRPDRALTVDQVFEAVEHGLYGCECKVADRRAEREAMEATIADLRKRLSAP